MVSRLSSGVFSGMAGIERGSGGNGGSRRLVRIRESRSSNSPLPLAWI